MEEGEEEREREKKNEYESAKDGAQVRWRERMRGMCIRRQTWKKGQTAREGQKYSQGTTEREKRETEMVSLKGAGE
jgi:hypothetical protein